MVQIEGCEYGIIITLKIYMQMWPSLIAKAKEGGVDVIQTYVFWNLHEPQPGQVRRLRIQLYVCMYLSIHVRLYFTKSYYCFAFASMSLMEDTTW